MKDLFKHIQQKFQGFLNGREEPDHSKADSLTSAIKEALLKKTAVHIIFSDTSFTGDIIKFDTDHQQIIVKNFAKNVTRIIRIPDIQKISFVPSTVQTAQKNRFKKFSSSHSFLLTDLFKMKVNSNVFSVTTSL